MRSKPDESLPIRSRIPQDWLPADHWPVCVASVVRVVLTPSRLRELDAHRSFHLRCNNCGPWDGSCSRDRELKAKVRFPRHCGHKLGARPKTNLVAFLNETRLTALPMHVLHRESSALGVAVDAACNKATDFFICEDKVMRFVDAHAEPLPSPFHQLDEVGVPKIHALLIARLLSAFHANLPVMGFCR